MGSWVWVGFAAFFVVALVVGVRVLLLALRTHELPELAMGIGVLGIGPVGFGLMVIGIRVAPGVVQSVLLGIAVLAISCGVLANLVFNWRVYRPDSSVARMVAVAGGAGLFACFAWSGVVHGFTDVGPVSTQSSTRSALQVACLLWSAAEALAYWSKMRRRVRVGLADPVVANRFLMWGVATFSAGLGTAIGLVAQLVLGVASTDSGWVMASSSLHGLVAAVAIALAFIPPGFYVRYIRGLADHDLAALRA